MVFTITVYGLIRFIAWAIFWTAIFKGNDYAIWLTIAALILLDWIKPKKKLPAK